MLTFATIWLYAGLVSNLAIFFGVPIAIYKYWESKRKEQRDRENGTYGALDEKYLEFEQICLRMPELNVFDFPDGNPAPLNVTQQRQEPIAFTMLFFDHRARLSHGPRPVGRNTRAPVA
jgi:hypothetical protein